MIGGNDDTYTPPEESEQLAQAFQDRQWLWLIDGLSHGEISDLDDEACRERVITFFKEELSS